MKCPNDGTPLNQYTYEADIQVDQCPSCRGMWLDADELERIEESSVNDYQEEIRQLPNLVEQAYAMALARTKPTVRCPQCGAEMERLEHAACSQVLIDACPKCRGVWLDEGEIQALEVFFERTKSETREVRVGFFARLMHLFD